MMKLLTKCIFGWWLSFSGPGNFCLVHVSLVPVLNVVGEQVYNFFFLENDVTVFDSICLYITFIYTLLCIFRKLNRHSIVSKVYEAWV